MKDRNVECPYCKHEFDSDDLYNAKLYQEDDETEVECPGPLCKKRFMVRVSTIFQYEVKDMQEFEEDGGFF